MADVLDDEEWERTVEDVLEESAHDTELGKRMGRDAIRVSIGEMSEGEFQEKYHEDVVEEFGVDNRPTKQVKSDE
ncbi:Uncharacterized protein AArcCO_2909 [Halalkaliarchaeum sp. AArc-CO]|nr:4Fe-4S ferredoxin N-terminal domain-containing protein [Halalkaliarchaeum sp. AArc-CO]UWG52183.1 Uncharacterized protein AArcCO_2909 [Halalkaliarchaeum sp. AArc-CO]